VFNSVCSPNTLERAPKVCQASNLHWSVCHLHFQSSFVLCPLCLPMCLLQDKQGMVKHVYRGNVFIQARDLLENAGVIVCKAKHLEQAGISSNSTPVIGGSGIIPQSPRLSSPAPHRAQGVCVCVCVLKQWCNAFTKFLSFISLNLSPEIMIILTLFVCFCLFYLHW